MMKTEDRLLDLEELVILKSVFSVWWRNESLIRGV